MKNAVQPTDYCEHCGLRRERLNHRHEPHCPDGTHSWIPGAQWWDRWQWPSSLMDKPSSEEQFIPFARKLLKAIFGKDAQVRV